MFSNGTGKEGPFKPQNDLEDLENWPIEIFGSLGASSSICARWRLQKFAIWCWKRFQQGRSDKKPMKWFFFFQGWLPRSHLLMKIKEKDGLPLPVIINIGQSTIGRRLSGPMSPALKLVNNTSKWWSGERLERKSNPAAWSPHSRVGGPLSWCGVHSLAREPPLLLSCRQSDAPPKILLKLCMRALGPWIQSFDRSDFFFLNQRWGPSPQGKD